MVADDINKAASALAIGQSIGNPDKRSPYENDKMWADYGAEVVSSVKKDDKFDVEIRFPDAIFSSGSLTHLLTVVMGGQLDIDIIKECHLYDLKISESLVSKYKGPKYGTDGIRKLLNAYDRPLIGGIVKPKTGLSMENYLAVVKELILGGVDFIKEDEILGEIPELSVLARIKEIDKMIARLETPVIFAPAINVDVESLDDTMNDLELLKNVKAFHFNFWGGLDLFKYLAHRSRKAAFYQKSGDRIIAKGPYSIDFKVWCKLIRLAGADFTHAGMLGSYLDETKEVLEERFDALMGDTNNLQGTIPSLSCGATPTHVPLIRKHLGNDVMVSSGGAIHAFEDGVTAGAKAFKDAALGNFETSEYKMAVEKYGIAEL